MLAVGTRVVTIATMAQFTPFISTDESVLRDLYLASIETILDERHIALFNLHLRAQQILATSKENARLAVDDDSLLMKNSNGDAFVKTFSTPTMFVTRPFNMVHVILATTSDRDDMDRLLKRYERTIGKWRDPRLSWPCDKQWLIIDAQFNRQTRDHAFCSGVREA